MNFYRIPQAKWDKAHLMTVSTHLTRKQYDRLQNVCRRDGTKPYRLLRRFLLDYIAYCEEVQEREEVAAKCDEKF